MATETIRIIVQTSGTQQASKQLLSIAGAAERTNKSINAMNAALRATAAVALGRSLTALSDVYTNLENRTKVFASSTLEARDAFKGVFEVALRARAPLDATGELFGRLQLALQGTGKGSAELLRITETVTKAIAISGATAQEADGALRQLAQGMAANRLSGQELNSVLEQTPVIAKLIARELGISADKLRQVANKEGAITRDVIIRALSNSAAYIDELFSKTAVTFGQAFSQMRTAVTELFGNILKDTGIANDFAGAISRLAIAIHEMANNKDTVKDLGIALKVLGGILAALAVAQTIAWATNPIGLFAIAVGGILTLYLKYRDVLVTVNGESESIGLRLQGIWEAYGRAVSDVIEFVKDLLFIFEKLWGVVGLFKSVTQPLLGFIFPSAENIDAMREFMGFLLRSIPGLSLLMQVADVARMARTGGEGAAAPGQQGIGPAQTLTQDARIELFNIDPEKNKSSAQIAADLMKLEGDEMAKLTERMETQRRATEELDRQEKQLAVTRDQEATKAMIKAGAAYDKLVASLDPLLAVQQEYVKNLEIIKHAEELGSISSATAAQGLQLLNKEYQAQMLLMTEYSGAQKTIIDNAQALVLEMDPLAAATDDYTKKLKALESAKFLDPANAQQYAAAQAEVTRQYELQISGLDQLIEKQQKLEEARATVSEAQGARNPAIGAFNSARGDIERLNEAARNSGGDAQLLADIAVEREAILKKMEEDQQAIINPDLTGMEAFKEGAIGSLHELGTVFADEATIWKEGFDNVFSTIGDAIKGFVETGKLDFRELGLAFAEEISMMMLKMLALKALEATSSALGNTGGIGGAIGGIAGAIAGGARASGGPVDPGRSFIVGEHGPETFTPNTAGMVTPGAGGNTSVTFNITTKDADSFRASKTQIESEMAGALARARQRNG